MVTGLLVIVTGTETNNSLTQEYVTQNQFITVREPVCFHIIHITVYIHIIHTVQSASTSFIQYSLHPHHSHHTVCIHIIHTVQSTSASFIQYSLHPHHSHHTVCIHIIHTVQSGSTSFVQYSLHPHHSYSTVYIHTIHTIQFASTSFIRYSLHPHHSYSTVCISIIHTVQSTSTSFIQYSLHQLHSFIQRILFLYWAIFADVNGSIGVFTQMGQEFMEFRESDKSLKQELVNLKILSLTCVLQVLW